jgi:N-acetylmuramoyl-L-alanine amidase/IPT/TIG domain
MAQFVGPVPASNYLAGRAGHSMQFVDASDPSYVVIHTMVGTIASADGRFNSPAAQVSAHYGVGLDGRVVQWVGEPDTAFHAGNWEMNLNSIGIEHEDNGDFNGPRSDGLYGASSSLVADICGRYGIPINRAYVIRHNEVPGSSTGCPDALDIDRIVAMAAGTWRDPRVAIAPVPPTYPLADNPPAGTTIEVAIQGAAVIADAHWFSGPNGQDMGPAPSGASVTVQGAVFDGTNWWDQIAPGVAPGAAAWWLLDSAVDTSNADHPASTNPSPAIFWNDTHKPAATPSPQTPAAAGSTVASPITGAADATTAPDATPAAGATGSQGPTGSPDAGAAAGQAGQQTPPDAASTAGATGLVVHAPASPFDVLGSLAASVLGDHNRWAEIHNALQGLVQAASTSAQPSAQPPGGQPPGAPGPPDSTAPPPASTPPGSTAGSSGPAGAGGPPGPPGPPNPPPAAGGQDKAWGGSQAAIFAMQFFYLAILGALAIIYFTNRALIGLPETLGPVSVAVPWFGALGAVLISIVGVTEHRGDWDPSYRFWHWSRPLLGASFGTISVLIFQAGILAVGSTPSPHQQNITSNLLYYLVAFLVGYREETFRELMKRLTDIVLAPGQTRSLPAISSMSPANGPAKGGTSVTIIGSSLSGTQAVRFGATHANFNIDSDNQLTVVTPAGIPGTSVSVAVLSKDGTVSGGSFSYSN